MCDESDEEHDNVSPSPPNNNFTGSTKIPVKIDPNDSDTDSDQDQDDTNTVHSSYQRDSTTIRKLLESGKKRAESHNKHRKKKQRPVVQDLKRNHNPQSHKRVLCFNILNRGNCPYGEKCAYAHHLDEQQTDSIRVQAYDIIRGTQRLDHLDLVANNKLYHTLKQLCSLCPSCAKGYCPGGYNCTYGAYCKQTQLCKRDLMEGGCIGSCDKVHLTTRGLKPYTIQINRGGDKDKGRKLRRFARQNKPHFRTYFAKSRRSINRPPVKGVQLSENYFRTNPQKLTDDTDSDISMDDEELERIKQFLDGGESELTLSTLPKMDDTSVTEPLEPIVAVNNDPSSHSPRQLDEHDADIMKLLNL